MITGEKRSNICRYCSLQNYRDLDPRIKLYYSAKQRAKKINVAFDLTPGDIVIPTHCPALEIELKDYTGSGKPDFSKNHDAATIDRIDNSKGYVAGNIQVISKRANLLKKDGSVQELAGILCYMLECEGRNPEVASALKAIATENQSQ